MVFAHVKDLPNRRGTAAIPSISSPAHRLAAFLHKSSTGSCTETWISSLAGRRNRGPACHCQRRGSAALARAAAADRRATVSKVARLRPSQGNSSMGPAPVAPLGLCFPPSTTAVSRRCAWSRDRHRGLDRQPAGPLAPGQPRNRGAKPYEQACCDASGPRCQIQGGTL